MIEVKIRELDAEEALDIVLWLRENNIQSSTYPRTNEGLVRMILDQNPFNHVFIKESSKDLCLYAKLKWGRGNT